MSKNRLSSLPWALVAIDCALANVETLQAVILQKMVAALFESFRIEREAPADGTLSFYIGTYEDDFLGSQSLG